MNLTNKNFKQFRKQNYMQRSSRLPKRILLNRMRPMQTSKLTATHTSPRTSQNSSITNSTKTYTQLS